MLSGLLALLPSLGAPVAAAQPETPDPVMTFDDARLDESSGLVASRTQPGLLWTISDSGSPAELYGVRDGDVVAVVALEGVENVDWEALAPGPGGTLWVGDIGDNAEQRESVSLHVLAEPRSVGGSTVRPRSTVLRYPDGAHDAEALLVHPRTGQVRVVTKSLLGGAVYAADRVRLGGTTRLRRVAAAPPLVTDGAWAPDGTRFALRTYGDAVVRETVGGDPVPVELPPQEQGESLAWTTDGSALLAGSEGRGSVVWRVAVPRATPTPAPTVSVSRTPTPTEVSPSPRAADDDGADGVPWLGLGAAALAAVVGGLLLQRRGQR